MFRRSTDWLGRLTLPWAVGIAASFALVWGAAGLLLFERNGYWVNIWTEFWGVILGGGVVAYLFNSVLENHQEQRWQIARRAIFGDLRWGLWDGATAIAPDIIGPVGADDFEDNIPPPVADQYLAEADWLRDTIKRVVRDYGWVVAIDECELSEQAIERIELRLSGVESGVRTLQAGVQRALDRLIYAEGDPSLIALLVELEQSCRFFWLDSDFWVSRIVATAAIIRQIADVAEFVETEP